MDAMRVASWTLMLVLAAVGCNGDRRSPRDGDAPAADVDDTAVSLDVDDTAGSPHTDSGTPVDIRDELDSPRDVFDAVSDATDAPEGDFGPQDVVEDNSTGDAVVDSEADIDGEWSVEGAVDCLCEDLTDRCIRGYCYRPIGRSCTDDRECPAEYSCWSPPRAELPPGVRICSRILESSVQYCPGPEFPDRVCPVGESCDARGVFCSPPPSCVSSIECEIGTFCHDCNCEWGGRGCLTEAMYAELLTPLQFAQLVSRCSPPPVPAGECVSYDGYPQLADPGEVQFATPCRLTADCGEGEVCAAEPFGLLDSGLDWGFCTDEVPTCPPSHVSLQIFAPEDYGCVEPGARCTTDADCSPDTQCMRSGSTTLYDGSWMCGYAVDEAGARVDRPSARPAPARPEW